MQVFPAPAKPNASLDATYVNESDHTKAVHDSLGIDANTVGGDSASFLLSRTNHTGTQAIATLSDHNKANHDSLLIDAATLGGNAASVFSTLNNTPRVFNVKGSTYGATGNGTTDDTTAIQAAINASSTGDIIFFPTGTYLISSTLSLKPWRVYQGINRAMSVIKVANGANLDALAASEGWLGSSITAAEGPIRIENLGLNGNKANQASGTGHNLVLMNFWSVLERLEVTNAFGDGIRWTSARKDGTEISGSMVENYILNSNIRAADGYGIRIHDPTPTLQTVTDGYIQNCNIDTPGNDGIRIDTAIGWTVRGNHLYGTPKHGIHVNRAGACRIEGNYLETWGTSGTAGTYAAICAGDNSATWIGDSTPVIISGNTAYFNGGSDAGSSIRGILCSTSNGATSHIAITNNGIYNTGAGAVGVGVRLVNQGATGNTVATISGNRVDGWPANNQYAVNANSGTIVLNGDKFPQALGTTATAGFVRLPSTAGVPTGVPTNTNEGIATLYDSVNDDLYAYNGAWVNLTPAASSKTYVTRTEARTLFR